MKFRTTIKQSDGAATGIVIPDESDETRQRRIEKSVAVLREGKPR